MTKRILLIAVVAAAIFARCDSMNMIELDSATESNSLIEAVRTYYETAIQPNGLNGQPGGKISGDSTKAVVLAEMVRQYPPDWSQAVTWARDGGGYHVATVIGADKPATAHSPDTISVIRTLIAEANADGKVSSARIVEFSSPDPLDQSRFQDYAKEWLSGNYGTTKRLAAEYSTAYDSEKALFYDPADSTLAPNTVRLEQITGVGKVLDDPPMWCWVSDVQFGTQCTWTASNPEDKHCINLDMYIIYTCISLGDDTGSGGDGDGDGGGGDGSGGSGGGSGDDGGDDDEESGTQFALTCTSPVTRGSEATCTVNVSSEDNSVTAGQFTYEWSSSTSATWTGTGRSGNVWAGVATGTATISVAVVSEGFTASEEVVVSARTGWSIPALNAAVSYDLVGNNTGYYEIPDNPPFIPQSGIGSGPWAWHYMAGSAPSIEGRLLINSDYSSNGLRYPNANTQTCTLPSATLRSSENYATVNAACGTTFAMNDFVTVIERHERQHEAGINTCLASSTVANALVAIEAINGTDSHVNSEYRDQWADLYNDHINQSGMWGQFMLAKYSFWNRYTGAWSYGKPGVGGHPNAQYGC